MARQSGNLSAFSLFTQQGERKYLSEAELARFYAALDVLENPKDRSLCETLLWTGCRITEALNITAMHVDVAEGYLIIRSLKKRGEKRGTTYRPVPVPKEFVERLDALHGITAAQGKSDGGASTRLWTISRTTAWLRIKRVMDAAGLSGVKACPKGLRHAFGVLAAVSGVPESRIKKWMGHESLVTTEIYMDMSGAEDREIAERLWARLAQARAV